MRISFTLTIYLVLTFCSNAAVHGIFDGWDNLQDISPCILVIKCGVQAAPKTDVIIVGGPNSDCQVDRISVLKGSAATNSFRLQTDHELMQGEYYLVYGTYKDGILVALEEYRVIPLGTIFSPSIIAGKPLEEQLQRLFRQGVFTSNLRLELEQAEKNRLSEALNK